MRLIIQCAPIWLPPLLFWLAMRRVMNDDLDPRPFTAAFVGGAAIALLIARAANYFPDIIISNAAGSALVHGWLCDALPEEMARAAFLAIWIDWKGSYQQPHSIISASLAICMGSVIVENVFRVEETINEPMAVMQLLLFRHLFSLPTYVAFGVGMGVMVAWSRGRNWPWALAKGTVLTVAAHGFYDSAILYAVSFDNTLAAYLIVPAAALAVVIAYLPVQHKFRQLIAANDRPI